MNRVLIVDDEMIIRETMRAFFEMAGVASVVAKTLGEAVRFLEENQTAKPSERIDAVLTDYNYPDGGYPSAGRKSGDVLVDLFCDKIPMAVMSATPEQCKGLAQRHPLIPVLEKFEGSKIVDAVIALSATRPAGASPEASLGGVEPK